MFFVIVLEGDIVPWTVELVFELKHFNGSNLKEKYLTEDFC